MKKIRIMPCLLLILCALGVNSVHGQDRPVAAVSDFTGKGLSPQSLEGLKAYFEAELGKTGAFRLLERTEIDKLLKEKEFISALVVDDSAALRMGSLLGARYIVVGAASAVGKKIVLAIKLLDVEAGTIAKSELVEGSDDEDLIPGVRKAAWTFAGRTGTVFISTDPLIEGAIVSVSGMELGTSPSAFTLFVGNYEITVSAKTGDTSYEGRAQVLVREGAEERLVIGLRQSGGSKASGDQASGTQGRASAPEGMVRVRGGSFTMGSPKSEAQRESDEAQRTVAVSDFLIGRYELSFEDYDAYCAATGAAKPSDAGWGRGKRPAIAMSWYDAVEYCNWRSAIEGLSPCYSIDKSANDPNNSSPTDTAKWAVACDFSMNGYRLPTEAEWEFACRAGSAEAFAFGKSLSSAQANFNGGYPYGSAPKGLNLARTEAAGSYPANAYGIYDMHGNVWEWCWDWLGEYGNSPERDPLGPKAGRGRVLRGGAWDRTGNYLRSANRNSSSPNTKASNYGFRLARSMP